MRLIARGRHAVRTRALIAILLIALIRAVPSARAADTTGTSSVSISIQQVFSMEFYTDQNTLYSDTVPFTGVDSAKSFVYADGRMENDGKSDTGVVCKSNAGLAWFLKLHLAPKPPLTVDKMKYYVDQPYNRNTGGRADGTLTQSANWYIFNATPTTIYTAGYLDKSNLPYGTLFNFNFGLIPSGLDAGRAYTATITYTMTTAA